MSNHMSAKMVTFYKRTIFSTLILTAPLACLPLAAQFPQQTVNTAPAAAPKSDPSNISNKPPDIPVDQIVQKFGARELEFKKERDNYTYTQTFVVQTIDFDGRPDGLRLFVRELLSSLRYPSPPPAAVPHTALLPGESAPGEAARAKEILDEGQGREDRDFVHLAYERILGRAPDADGEAFYVGKLSQGELSRPGFLRELFWSGEGHARWGRHR